MPEPPSSVAPVPGGDPALIGDLRADLDAADYTVEALTEALGPAAAAALRREQPVPARRALAAVRTPAAVLARLFTLGESLDPRVVAAALPRLGLDGARRLGLISVVAGAVRACLDLRPYGDGERAWWVVSDLSELATGRPLHPDHVLGVGGASTTLAGWTPRRPVSRALDLGTGCGVQALHAATHAAEVIATDVSARALAMARFTAALNQQVWDLRLGSMLEPVAGQRFDLVVSNPPFVITPRVVDLPRYVYRDGGRRGDAVTAELVRSLPDRLEPGGVAQLLGNWEVREGEDWRDVVRGWLAGTDVDAWVVQRERSDVCEYAELWIRDGGRRRDGPDHDRMYRAWLDDFAERGVAVVGYGVITLHRPERPRAPFCDLMDHRGPVGAPLGPAVEAGLIARSWLAEHDDVAALARRWRLAEGVVEQRIGQPGAADPAVIRLCQGSGLRLTLDLDTVGAAFVSVADGELTADQAAVAIAALLDADTDGVRARLASTLRLALRHGMLLLPSERPTVVTDSCH